MAADPPPDTEATLHRALGLTDDEATLIEQILGRAPNHLELAMYAVMWSEHCSYKSSRIHLRGLPTEAPHVLVGPGEGAGVVDVGDGIAAAFRIESHNHPSAIEPYQGAATGVGGILRDVFSIGARPIALMDPLRFGPLDDARSRWIAEGVISGVSGYGNSVGVPTVGGETVFDDTYQDNPLVNVLLSRPLAPRPPRARLARPGRATSRCSSDRPPVGTASVGRACWPRPGSATTARTRTSARACRSGDPFEEKRLIEACLELLDAGLVVGIQDLGGAGITCATSETSSKGGVGMDVHVADVHVREEGMEPFEVMTSESQERMLAIVEPGKLDARARRLHQVGDPGVGHRDRHGHRPLPGARSRRRPTCWPISRPARWTTTLPSTTAPSRSRRPERPGSRTAPRRRRQTTSAPTSSRCWSTRPGSSASTTTSCS